MYKIIQWQSDDFNLTEQTPYNKTKHIDIKNHLEREATDLSIVELRYMCSKGMIADIFTKPL